MMASRHNISTINPGHSNTDDAKAAASSDVDDVVIATLYNNSFFTHLSPNFDAFSRPLASVNTSTNDRSPSGVSPRVISKDYFLAIGKLSKNNKFKMSVRDFCVTKEAKEQKQVGRSIEFYDEMVEKEIKERTALRDQVRLFAKKKLLLHYRTVFLEEWTRITATLDDQIEEIQSLPRTFNSLAEIQVVIDGLLKWATNNRSQQWTKTLLKSLGTIMYGSFRKFRGWELIQASAFMSENNIVYDSPAGKGCIAKSITSEKSEMNKTFQLIGKKYGYPITSRISKKEIVKRKNPGSSDFYVGTGNRVQSEDGEERLQYCLISSSSDPVAEPERINKTTIINQDINQLRRQVDHQNPYVNLVNYMLLIKLNSLTSEGIPTDYQNIWFRKILKVILQIPCSTMIPQPFQDMTQKLLNDTEIGSNDDDDSSDELEVSCHDDFMFLTITTLTK